MHPVHADAASKDTAAAAPADHPSSSGTEVAISAAVQRQADTYRVSSLLCSCVSVSFTCIEAFFPPLSRVILF